MKSALFSLTVILVATTFPIDACAESLRSQAKTLTDRASAALSREDYESSADYYEKALMKWKSVVKQNPQDSEAQSKISHCETNLKYSLARPSDEALDLADVHSEKKEFEKAAKCFKAAIEGYQKAHRRLGKKEFAQNLRYAEVNYARTNFAHVVETSGKAPQFDLESLRKGRVKLSDYRGKTVLLVHWAAWCGYCQRELPALQELYDRYRHKGLVVVGLSADRVGVLDRGGFAEAKGMADKVTYPLAWTAEKTFAEYGSPLRVPNMIWIDPQGRLVKIVEKRKIESLEQDFLRIQKEAGPKVHSDEANQQRDLTFTIDEVGLSLTLPPSEWKGKLSQNQNEVKLIAFRDTAIAGNSRPAKLPPNLRVVVKTPKTPLDAEGYAKLAVPLLEKSNWTVQSQRPVRWESEKGVDIRAEKDNTALFMRVMIGKGGKVIVLCAMAHPQQAEEVEGDFQSIFDSCRITSID